MHSFRRFLASIAACAVLCTGAWAIAAPPTVRSVSVRGLQIGGVTTLAIDGSDLLPNPRLAMSIPIAGQTVKPNATDARVEIDVTLDDKASPGLCNLFLATDGGVSERIVVALDRLPQRPFAATVEALPVAMHGALGGGMLKTTFAGQAGQAIICEVESQRLGAKVRPVLHLYDPEGKHLAWSLPNQGLRGDTRLLATLPAAGQYTLTLNDLQYNAPAPNHYRLKLGQWQFADVAFPAAVQRGTTGALRLVGNVAADKLVNIAANLEAAQSPVPWPEPAAASGPVPAVFLSDLPEFVEQPPGAAIQEIGAIPAGMNGRLAVAAEEDRFKLKVQPDAKLRFELFAARLGAPLDTALELRRENGAVLAANDDAPGTTDSLLDFTVPKDVDALIVAIKDAHGRGSENSVYRLQVSLPATPPLKPDFRLIVEQDRHNVLQAGKHVVKVRVDRQGYQGPIKLAFGQIPPGVAVEGMEIPAGVDAKLITLAGSGEAFGQFLTSIRGTSLAELNPPVTRLARFEQDPIGQFQPWLVDEVAVSLAARAGNAFDGDWQPPADVKLVLGGKLQVLVKCVRPVGFDGPVRLTLLTGQSPPQANGQNDPNRTLRSEAPAPIEIPSDPKAVAAWDAKLAADKVLADAQVPLAAAVKAVADAQTAGGAALEAATKAKADAEAKVADAQQKLTAAAEAANAAAAAAKNDVNYVMLVPADLPPAPVELAFRAELLSRDKQRVLLTLCTPVRAVPVANPLKLTYAGPPKVQAKLDAKTGVGFELVGKIERLEGLAGDVSVSVAGLPAGVPVPKVAVKADQTDYKLELKFPPTTPPGEIQGIKLFVTGKYSPQSPLEVKSPEVPVVIEVLPP